MRQILVSLLCVTCFALSNAIALNQEQSEKIITKLESIIPDLKVDAISPSPIAGIYQVRSKTEIFFVTEQGDYLFYGSLLDLNKDKSIWDITEMQRRKVRLKLLAAVDPTSMIIFSPKTEKIGTVTVFTDIDCGYCQKLHGEIEALTEAGVEIRYLAFPRSGVGTESFDKSVSVWCADDPKDMITLAKKGQAIPEKSCENNPVAQQFTLGKDLGVRGTPTLVFDDGRLLSSYVPAVQLIKLVEGIR